jgi:hypothetical protein
VTTVSDDVINAEDLRDADDLEDEAEKRRLRREVSELKDMVHRLSDRVEELEEQQNDGDDHSYACDAEKALRLDALDSLSAYEERVARIWKELPKHAKRNGLGNVTYTLDSERLSDALAAVDDQWTSGQKVHDQQVQYAREAFEDMTPAEVKSGEGGSKKVIVYARKWSLDRPDEVTRRLMKPKDVAEFVEGGDS